MTGGGEAEEVCLRRKESFGCSIVSGGCKSFSQLCAAARQHLALKRSPIKKGCWERASRKKKKEKEKRKKGVRERVKGSWEMQRYRGGSGGGKKTESSL